MFIRDARTAEDVLRLAAAASDPGFGLVHWPEPWSSGEAVQVLAAGLKSAGFVVIRSSRIPTPAVLNNRHLAVLAEGREGPALASWMRRAGLRSTRSHLLVYSAVPARKAAVKEGAPGYASRATRPVSSRAWQRARRCSRQGRGASACRWLRAAALEAERRGDGAGALLVAGVLVRRLMRRGDWTRAWRLLRDLAQRVDDIVVADEAARMASSLAVHVGRLAEAEAMAGATAGAAALRHGRCAAWVARRMGEIRLLQGRKEEAVAWLDQARENGRGDLLQAAAAWLADVPLPSQATCTYRHRHAEAAVLAVSALRLAAAHRTDELAGVDGRLADATRRQPRWVLAARGLPAAAVMQALAENRCQQAPRAIRRVLETRMLSPVQMLVTHTAGPRQPPARAVRVGAARRTELTMEDRMPHLTCQLPDLLERVADAEDDMAVLDAACRWARQQPGVDGVALVGCAGEWVRTDGVVRAGLTAEVLAGVADLPRVRLVATRGALLALAPVRYAGATIGAFVVHAGLPTAETAREAAAFGAPVCGPAMRARLDALAASRRSHDVLPELVGESPAMAAVRAAVARAATTSFPVLVEGESGTGKELVARGVHRLSARRDRAFCPVNCAALTDELVEAELFGHARGAFTGAAGARAGLFEEAHRGTLFLDEVSELSGRAQAKVLRALQEGEIRRVGENTPRRVDVRIVGATNRPLADAVATGSFREDLLFRLAVARIRLPPLRERVEDLPDLVRLFWRRAAMETNTRARLGPDALARLVAHRWPGNVRELQNAMAALVLAAPVRGRVCAALVSRVLGDAVAAGRPGPQLPLRQARQMAERRRVVEALARHGGRRTAAARELGLSRQGLAKAVRRLGLSPSRRRAGVA